MSERTTIYIPSEKTLKLFENPDQQANININPEAVGPEISFAVDNPELDRVIQLVTTLSPDRAFCFMNEQLLYQQAQRFQRLFLPEDPRQAIAYAVKANPRARILEIFGQAGLSFADCSSPGEIEQVRKHWPQATPLYTYPSKFPYEIREALDQGVRYFTVEDEREIKKILKESQAKGIPDQDIEISIRVSFDNPEADMDLSEKFGEEALQAIPLIKVIREQTKAKLALSINTGSQNRNPSSYLHAFGRLLELAQIAKGVSSLNLGGGFPVNYAPEDGFSLEEYLTTLSQTLRGISSKLLHGPDPKLIIEPGRALVAEAVDLVIPIRNRKRKDGEDILLIDDGIFSCFIDALIHGWTYYFEGIGRGEKKLNSERTKFTLQGRSETKKDQLKIEIDTSNVNYKDYLLNRNAGAYLDCQGGKFSGFLLPKYITYNLL